MTKTEYERRVAEAELNDTVPPEEPARFDPEPEAGSVLSAAERQAALDKARSIVLEKRKDAAIAFLIDQETVRLQREEGLHSGDPVMDESVRVRIDLPEFAAYLSLNGRQYWHGHSYEQPRHVTNTLREMQQRAWDHQAEIDGKSKNAAYRKPLDTRVSGSGAIQNAPVMA